MSTMVLNLPTSYVDVDRDEMEYVEGGGYLYVNLSVATQQKILTWGAATVAGSIAAALTYASGGALAAIAPIIASGIAGCLTDIMANNLIRNAILFSYYHPLIPGKWYLGTI